MQMSVSFVVQESTRMGYTFMIQVFMHNEFTSSVRLSRCNRRSTTHFTISFKFICYYFLSDMTNLHLYFIYPQTRQLLP